MGNYIDETNDSLRQLNEKMNCKLLKIIASRKTKSKWNFNRTNYILIYDDNPIDLKRAELALEVAFSKYKYVTKMQSVSTYKEFKQVNNIKFYISFLDYNLSDPDENEKVMETLKSQNIIIVTSEDYSKVADMVEQYDCYFLPKPYSVKDLTKLIDSIQNKGNNDENNQEQAAIS